MNNKKTKRKVFRIIENGVFTIIILVLAYVIVGGLIAKRNNEEFAPFGLYFNLVVTDSMEPEIKVGDLVVCKKTNISDVKEGDSVLFRSLSGQLKGQMIIHQALKVENIDGEIKITTKGINAIGAEKDYLTQENFYGIASFNSSFFGAIAKFLSSWVNWVFLVIIYITIRIAIVQGIKLLKELKKQQLASEKINKANTPNNFDEQTEISTNEKLEKIISENPSKDVQKENLDKK